MNARSFYLPAALACLVLSVAAWQWRTTFHPGVRFWDFSLSYTAAAQWVDGQVPGDEIDMTRRWRDAGGAPRVPDDLTVHHYTYAPPTLVLVSPLTPLTPAAATRVWSIVLTVLVMLTMLALVRLAALRWTDPRAMLLMAGGLIFGPLRQGIQAGQYAVVSVALIVIGSTILFAQRPARTGREWLGAILLGLGTAMKLQLGVPFVVYCLIRKRWLAAAVSGAIFVGCLGIGLVRTQLAGHDALASWRTNITEGSAPGGPLDFGPLAPDRDQLVNAQLPVFAIFENRPLANVAAMGIAGAGMLALMFKTWKLPRDDSPVNTNSSIDSHAHAEPLDLLPLAALSVIALLPGYHRYYDAAILLIPWAWAVRTAGLRRGWGAWIVLGILMLFMLPAAPFSNLIDRGILPMTIRDTALWGMVIQPFHAWVTLALLAALLMTGRQRRNLPQP